MPHYRRVGDVPPKRHTQFRAPDGRLYAEELMGSDGFSSSSALLYHEHPPTALVAAESVPDTGDGPAPNDPLLPRHLRTTDLPQVGDLVTGRRVLLANDDVRLAVARPTDPSGLYRNATGDEIVYLRTGGARLESSFGTLDCRPGDYVVIPTGTTHRWLPTGDEPTDALVIEARGHVGAPARYLSPEGQFLEHSPYCERDLHAPEAPPAGGGDGPADVLVRRSGGLTRYRYAHHPFDVVGWDGCLYPYRLSIHDFEPLTGRVHQPPPVHQTFAGPRFVVCSFVPRKLDYHPLAVPAPYNHANVDSDEVLYYCDGDFTSRKGSGIGAGSVSLHPAGFTHGPQPGSVEASLGAEATTELAVMIDTFRPLMLAEGARACEDPAYPWSWAATASP
ncbi:MAG TPA: homogentisate 1,2-dioxygenase [Acidimicrobiales bacterium]|nr:homogentisate 1,2-dioxygenase [Acidimicrobiales bacterium]